MCTLDPACLFEVTNTTLKRQAMRFFGSLVPQEKVKQFRAPFWIVTHFDIGESKHSPALCH